MFSPTPPRPSYILSEDEKERIVRNLARDMESSHSSTPHVTTPPPPADEATSSPPLTNRPVDYDSEFENWLEEPEGASTPTRKGKGKYYQIISSSEHDTSSSSPSDKDDLNYELSYKGG